MWEMLREYWDWCWADWLMGAGITLGVLFAILCLFILASYIHEYKKFLKSGARGFSSDAPDLITFLAGIDGELTMVVAAVVVAASLIWPVIAPILGVVVPLAILFFVGKFSLELFDYYVLKRLIIWKTGGLGAHLISEHSDVREEMKKYVKTSD